MTALLPVLIPAFMVTVGWIVVLVKQPRARWRMALLSASMSVFFLSISLGIFRYHQFGINVRLHRGFMLTEALDELLSSGVSVIETGVVTVVLNLLLAAWSFKTEHDCRRSKS